MVASSVASELVLAATATACAVAVIRRRTGAAWVPAAVGLGLLALAAGLGAVRYAGVDLVVSAHVVVSRLAAAGLAVVGLAWCATAFPHRGWAWAAWAVLAAAAALTAAWADGPWRLPLGVLGVLFGIVGSAAWLRTRVAAGLTGVLGAVGITVAGLAFDTDSTLLGLRQLDLFHLALAASVGVYGWGLAKTTPPR